MRVMLPTLPVTSLSISPSSPSLANDDGSLFPSSNTKSSPVIFPPRLLLPFSSPKHMDVDHNRRISISSTSSAPSLTYSPSPSPPPTRSSTPNSFLLVPCTVDFADALVVIPDGLAKTPSPSTPRSSASSPTASPRETSPPIFRPCKPSEARATLLIGPAISAHARKNAANGQRRMHPYRIVRGHRP